MAAALELQGQTFGLLRVEKRAGTKHGKCLWLCRCACGKEHKVVSRDLTNGHVRSCGCQKNPKKNRRCALTDCNRRHFARGRCWQHYIGPRRRTYKDAYLLKTFDLTLAEYEAQLAAQGGVCAICKEPERDAPREGHKAKMLAVDHDPKTGQLRNLLCRRCNTILGQVNDSPELLRTMASYLEEHGTMT